MLHARRFLRTLPSGSSLPLVVEADDGQPYVLKARGSGDGAAALVVDWLGLRLAAAVGLPALQPLAMMVPPGFDAPSDEPAARELLAASTGPNLCTRLVEDSRALRPADLVCIPLPGLDTLFLFDLLLLNIDREEANPNVIVVDEAREGDFRCLDYSAAMALRALVAGQSAAVADTPFLPALRRNPFYRAQADAQALAGRVAALPPSLCAQLCDELPADWLAALAPAVSRPQLAQGLRDLLAQAADLPRRLATVAATPLETADERRLRSQRNRAAFDQRHGKLGPAPRPASRRGSAA